MSSNPNEYRNPKRVNEPMMIFLWPAPKILPCLMLMGATILVGHFLFFFGLSVGWWILYGYTTTRFAPGVIFHYFWWRGLTTGLTKENTTVPDPLKREFLS